MVFRRVELEEARVVYDALLADDIGLTVDSMSFSEFQAGMFCRVLFYFLMDGQTRLAMSCLADINMYNRSACFAVTSFVRNRGMAVKVSRETCIQAFDKIGLKRLYTYIDVDNNESLAKFKDLSPFVFEGIRRHGRFKNGKLIDQRQYSILAEEFKTWATQAMES